ncbi:MAG: membrane protein insertion efficiency factor YidD [Proteobacteria bacterium]|nr:membrane protein insertion efficiency factor YidD [Pseudomonadota bacterium]MBU1397921.1 membrane protein insertion efficiency factor YidD [Pseudomonadota bacterium]MBU1570118.1 membrane protein insertion efficiency factor YidD [Pseudomonadota bacterium]
MIINKVFLLFIRGYQYVISPMIGPVCRFYPSCSEYAYVAIYRYGLIRGIFLAIKRILKCNPYNPGGIDPVP